MLLTIENSDWKTVDDAGNSHGVGKIDGTDKWFNRHFNVVTKAVVKSPEINIGQNRACYYEGILSVMDYSDTVEFSTSEAIELRNFLNQLNLGDK